MRPFPHTHPQLVKKKGDAYSERLFEHELGNIHPRVIIVIGAAKRRNVCPIATGIENALAYRDK